MTKLGKYPESEIYPYMSLPKNLGRVGDKENF
jgi:hypothetical protein